MLEPPVTWYIVGSTAEGKADPGDLDMIGVMEDSEFERVYGMRVPHKDDENYATWKAECRGARRVLKYVFPYRKVDFKFVPHDWLIEPGKTQIEVNLRELDDYR